MKDRQQNRHPRLRYSGGEWVGIVFVAVLVFGLVYRLIEWLFF